MSPLTNCILNAVTTKGNRVFAFAAKIKFPFAIATVALFFTTTPPAFAATPDVYVVNDYGAKGDGKTDDTAAFQKALDTAGQAGGGVVYAPRGNYFFAGHLNVPNGVTLKGTWESVPSHVGVRNEGAAKPSDGGT